MDLSNEKIREYTRRLIVARMRLLGTHGFFGLLLMHMHFRLDDECRTAYTDGENIGFSPNFLESLSESELDFVLMHEVMHVVLQHCTRHSEKALAGLDHEAMNMACDIVINSTIMLENNGDEASIAVGGTPSMHKTPRGDEGHKYTAEEVYAMLPHKRGSGSGSPSPKSAEGRAMHRQGKPDKSGFTDDHSHWGDVEDDETLRDVWVKRFRDACEAIKIREASKSRGTLPAFAERILDKLTKPQLDWRTILADFVQEEITDYSFEPPDRRFSDSPFFLPDFNEPTDLVKDILFMIDTSGSISDEMMTAAYSEVKGAIDQFGGKLQGWLGFFDAAIIEPVPFADEDEFSAIRPAGGGGTDFKIIFEYVAAHMQTDPPASIIILTDGYAPWPAEHLANGIPVLWLINNEEVTPPWGKIARIEV